MRAAIVGTGAIARVHARMIEQLGGTVVAACGRTLASAQAFGRGQAYSDVNAMLRDEKPDVVHICTPNRFHAEQSIAAFAAGAHVFCEKPMAVSSDECRRMIDAADRSRRVGAISYCYRGYPSVRELRQRVQQGEFGELWRVSGEYLSQDVFDLGAYQWHFSPGLCGPSYALMDLGIHWFDLIQYITGQPIDRVFAAFHTRRPRRTWKGGLGQGPEPAGTKDASGGVAVEVSLEDQADLLVSLAGGASGTCSVSALSAGNPNHISISVDGSEAGFNWQHEDPGTYVERRAGTKIIRYRDAGRLPDADRANVLTGAGNPDGYLDAFRNVISESWQAMQTGSADFPSFEAGLMGLEITEAAVSSARMGVPVALPSTRDRFASAYHLPG